MAGQMRRRARETDDSYYRCLFQNAALDLESAVMDAASAAATAPGSLGLVEGEAVADMPVEEGADRIGEQQRIVKFLWHAFVHIGSPALTEGRPQGMTGFVIRYGRQGGGLQARHSQRTREKHAGFPAYFSFRLRAL